MTLRLTRDTQLCMSLSARPGNFGTRFHNFLYEELGLDYVYKAFSTTDLPAAIAGIRALGVRGCAISMPFKEAVIPLADVLSPSAARLQSVNTLVNGGGRLVAYNTDYLAVRSLLQRHAVPRGLRVALRGSGGMARAVLAAIVDEGFAQGVVVARNEAVGRSLAAAHGYGWQDESGAIEAGLLVNATPIGMEGGGETGATAFTPDQVAAAAWVFDVVAMPAETPLIAEARRQGRPVITGAEVIALQAAEQFVLYTGVRPGDEQLARASAFARSGR
ncbi:Shikimate dehydrogenase substrate binding domain protein [Paracidovorax avenae ATCC 19860]|uniref:Shikimate dehydrogenase substrate binding domain protein n=1 Tax=Paracidovorax avenae (strain ATCC 19860 / DSM 7227 / CCUG 15838 / JCM 20985 / LMG 2117 / NCPPB 1011) TaxID=643561 RepID=F0Q583_PARA1|nr:shikimate 5-dehydrogenase [Paracidovorax avenae]ADX48039.1 Shikimate dehydrogenase substrate binding domain protein [Paracidovorax avenae ATCC 19860]